MSNGQLQNGGLKISDKLKAKKQKKKKKNKKQTTAAKQQSNNIFK
jgi:hypothetical protein